MQRNMSYRKPVPVYIPSPPPSPAPEPPLVLSLQVKENTIAQPAHPNEDLEGGKAVPPLPVNWREILAQTVDVIEAATSKADVTGSYDADCSSYHLEERDIKETPPVLSREPASVMITDKDHESFTTIAASQQLHPQIQRNGRGLPTKYRPPTPPLPRSHNKQVFSDTQYSHGVYLPRNSPDPYQRSYMQLKPSSSFRTERTMVSVNTTNYSMGWPNGQPTMSNTPMYSYPTLLIQKRNIEAARIPDANTTDPNHDCGCLFSAFKACWPKFGR